MTEEKINEEEVAFAQRWRDAMKRQVHNIIVSTLEASEAMPEEFDPDSDPEELGIELMAAALNAVAQRVEAPKRALWRWPGMPLRSISTESIRTTPSKSTNGAGRAAALATLSKQPAHRGKAQSGRIYHEMTKH
jgi:hypothetical protein